MDSSLSNFLKYCLGYIRLTRQGVFSAERRNSVPLGKDLLNLQALLDGSLDGSSTENIQLALFYRYNPADVPKKEKKQYEDQRSLARRIEELYNKQENYQFTKEAVVHFGYFEIELPETELVATETDEIENDTKESKTRTQRFPLFTLQTKIGKEDTQRGEQNQPFTLEIAESDLQINITNLEPVLGEEGYYQLLEQVNKLQMEGKLSLPIQRDTKIFDDIWSLVKNRLSVTEANYEDKSFRLEESVLALRPKANYFLAEDLEALAEEDPELIQETALASWVEDEGLNALGEIPQPEELYFPFPADKYQKRVTTLLNTKAGIVEGPPGTGKSETIANLLCHLAAQGKRVLFVSQKPQALKVVKDKLKRLEVEYLYGYVPNPSSTQLTEEDEIDGVANQLAALPNYLQKLGFNTRSKHAHSAYRASADQSAVTAPTLEDAVSKQNQTVSSFNQTLDQERRKATLLKESEKLRSAAFTPENYAKFAQNFDQSQWKKIQSLRREIARLDKEISKYKGSKRRYSNITQDLFSNDKGIAKELVAIVEDVNKSGYDKRSGFGRKMNNQLRAIRLRKSRSILPREVRDEVDKVTSGDLSRNEAVKELRALLAHCQLFENQIAIQQNTEELDKLCTEVGLLTGQLPVLQEFLKDTTVTKLLKSIEKYLELQKELEAIAPGGNLNSLASSNKDWDQYKTNRIAGYLRRRVNDRLTERMAEVAVKRQALQVARAFSKSKRAFKTFEKLRQDPDKILSSLDLLPIWIMELDDASRLLPLQAGLFDYVILDEASQCNVAYTLPSMFRAKSVIFVGDSEQMRDTTIGFKSNKAFDQLAKRYDIPEELRIKASGEAVQSVLDIARLRGLHSVPLQYHYRSPKELISFSNEYFYKPHAKELVALNNRYLPWRDTKRVMLIHEVKVTPKKEIAESVNVAEAEAILNFFKDLRKDTRYSNQSVGILTFFNSQASYLRELFEAHGFKESQDNFKISIIEGIQGDEKDIILYSFVIKSVDDKKRYLPLTGEGGDIQGGINRGRVNVAFSRARKQIHCFVSLPIEEIPKGIWIKKYLTYVEKHGEIESESEELQPFDSDFEEDFYNLAKSVLGSKHRIQNQVQSCGFKIDFVITDTKTGKTLAIECDGPTHFKNELDEELDQYVETDEERQRILEAAGWSFYRIKYSDWISTEQPKERFLTEIQAELSALPKEEVPF